MLLNIRIDAHQAREDLDYLERRVRDARPFMRIAAAKIYDKIREVFATEGYGTWPELSEPYASNKRAAVGNKTILRYSDRYYKAATSPTEDSIFEVTRRGLEIGVKSENFPDSYPLLHEEGDPERNLPPRPVFRNIDIDAEELVDDIERHLF